MNIHDHIDKVKRYYRFTLDEIKALFLTCFLLAFMLSFNEWGAGDNFEVNTGIYNLIITFLLVVIAILVHVSAQRISGLWVGFRIEYKMWGLGLIIGLLITVISRGKLFFLAPGGIFLHHLAQHRLGYFRYGINIWAQAMIVVWSIVATVALATIFKGLWTLFPGAMFLYKGMIINMWLAIFCLLPFPPLDGSRLLFSSRAHYAFAVGGVVTWAILLNFAPFWITIFGSILAAGIITLLYYVLFERVAWSWP